MVFGIGECDSRRTRGLAAATLIGATATLAACGSDGSQASRTQDIYRNDAETRHAASADEVLWTVSMSGGCTASALSARYVLTANHCSPRAGTRFTSGSALARGYGADMTATRVVESSTQLDYAIVEVRWAGGQPPADQRFSPKIWTKASELVLGRDGRGDKLFTVGFPMDRNQRATYAEGYAKGLESSHLFYNVGSINGNSGGAVWRSSDKMLVSLTNSGPHNYGQPGWNGNDPENSQAWNDGAAMYQVYARSAVLREIFPNGDNKYADAEGLLEADAL